MAGTGARQNIHGVSVLSEERPYSAYQEIIDGVNSTVDHILCKDLSFSYREFSAQHWLRKMRMAEEELRSVALALGVDYLALIDLGPAILNKEQAAELHMIPWLYGTESSVMHTRCTCDTCKVLSRRT